MSRHARHRPSTAAIPRRPALSNSREPRTVVADRLAALYRIGLEHRAQLEKAVEALTEQNLRLHADLIEARNEARELRRRFAAIGEGGQP